VEISNILQRMTEQLNIVIGVFTLNILQNWLLYSTGHTDYSIVVKTNIFRLKKTVFFHTLQKNTKRTINNMIDIMCVTCS